MHAAPRHLISLSQLAADTIALLCILSMVFKFTFASGLAEPIAIIACPDGEPGFSRLPHRYTCDGQARS